MKYDDIKFVSKNQTLIKRRDDNRVLCINTIYIKNAPIISR